MPIFGGGGGISSVVAVAPLSGGTITSSGSIGVVTGPTFTVNGSAAAIFQSNTAVPTLLADTLEAFIGTTNKNLRRATYTFGNASIFLNNRAEGSPGTLTAVGNNKVIGQHNFTAYDGTAYSSGVGFLATTTEVQSPGSHGARVDLFSIANGGVSGVVGLSLSGTLATMTNMSVSGTLASFPLGANLSLSGGTVVAIAGAGVVGALGAVANSGTITNYNTMAFAGTASGTLTISPTTGTSDVIITMPAGGGTVTVTSAPAFARQRMLWDIKQGATAGVLNLGTVFNMTGAITSFTITPTANAVDQIGWISPNGTVWKPEFLNQNGTI